MNALQNPKQFALAGNATITLESENTNNRFTYSIKRCENREDLYFVKLLRGPNNEEDYTYIGYYIEGDKFLPNKKYKEIPKETWPASMRAIRYFFDKIDDLPEKLHVYHEGRCGRCGRKLTTPESIKLGFGPECMKLGW